MCCTKCTEGCQSWLQNRAFFFIFIVLICSIYFGECQLNTSCQFHIYFPLIGDELKKKSSIMEPHGRTSVSFSQSSPCSLLLFLNFTPLPFLHSCSFLSSSFTPILSHPCHSPSLPLFLLPSSSSLHLFLYCKQLTKAWQGLCSCSPCLPLCSPSYLLLSPRYRVCLSLSRVLYSVFPLRQKKQKLIKYGTRWSSISLNHHVIKMASLGDQLKRSRRTMSSPSDIYGPGYVNMLPLFSMYISCNYHFL